MKWRWKYLFTSSEHKKSETKTKKNLPNFESFFFFVMTYGCINYLKWNYKPTFCVKISKSDKNRIETYERNFIESVWKDLKDIWKKIEVFSAIERNVRGKSFYTELEEKRNEREENCLRILRRNNSIRSTSVASLLMWNWVT